MSPKERAHFIDTLKSVFFRALLAGYAGDGTGLRRETGPNGEKINIWEEGDFRVIDSWLVRPDCDKSAGQTEILHNNHIAWWMSYCGEYKEPAIPFLKIALKRAYITGRFFGGRGPTRTSGELWVYRNSVYLGSRFGGNFGGEEEIRTRKGDLLGKHRYMGMCLLPNN